MGLWDLLTKEIKLTSDELQFNEPLFGRIRLRGDLLWRVVTVLGAWAAGIGVMSLLFSINQDPPGFGVAVGLGAVIGLAVAAQILFFVKKHVAGAITFFPDRIQRVRTYTVFLALRTQRTRWQYDGIENCRIALRSKSGLPYDVLTFEYGSERELVVLPPKVDPKQVVKVFSRHGVNVAATSKVPASALRPLPLAMPLVTCAVGMVLFVVGLSAFPWQPQPAGIERPEIAGVPDFNPREQFGVPEPVQPHQPFGGTNPGGAGSSGPFAQSGANTPSNSNESSSGASSPSTNAPSVPTFPPGFPRGGFPGPGGIPSGDPAAGMRPPTPSPQSPPGGFNRPDVNRAERAQQEMARSDRSTRDRFAGGANRSELVGGEGGIPFQDFSVDGNPVIGVKVRTGQWSGSEHLARVEPLYESEEQRPPWSITLARPGYVVGAVEVHRGEFVDGLRLTFMRTRADGQLDPADSYTSEWIGQPTENPTRLQREDQPIIGFYGLRGAVLDALGVVYAGE
ncbi:hypothetical protein Mal4_55100 [Maioricimonas rarisocia]|uniref:Jacalin-like lectin domain protein n=2 Tax=Maioricimonas rarisocia TaxID=2528026 RepID=A0A517ZF77_9PLAN|nr:hypothetical protein Mal4_55100 [Maioricimonas rarisocia]